MQVPQDRTPPNPRACEPGEVRPREAALGSWHPGRGTGQQLALRASLPSGSRRHLQCEPLGPSSLAGRLCPLIQCVLPSRCSWVSLSSPPTPSPCPTAAAPEPGWTCSPRTLQPRARPTIPRLPCTPSAPHRAGSLQGGAGFEGLPRVSLRSWSEPRWEKLLCSGQSEWLPGRSSPSPSLPFLSINNPPPAPLALAGGEFF